MRLDLKTGFACNNRCSFCVQGDRRRRLRHRPAGELREILAARAGSCDEVVFTGGECTLHPDLVELVEGAVSLGYRVQIQTNGRRFSDPAFTDAVVRAGAGEFCVGLHGARAATHDAQTGARGSWRQTVAGIRQLVRRRRTVLTNSVVTRHNQRELPAIVPLLENLGVTGGQLAMVHPLGTAAARFEEVVPALGEGAWNVRRALACARLLGVDLVVEALPPCLLRGFEDRVAELRMPPTRIEDPDGVVADYATSRVTEGKAKGPPCAACSWEALCEGPWREYPERFGWSDLRPRRDPPRR